MSKLFLSVWSTCFVPQLAASRSWKFGACTILWYLNLPVLLLDFSCYFMLDLFVCFMNKVIFIEPFYYKFQTKLPFDMLVSYMALELKLKTLSLNYQFQLNLDNSDFNAYLPSNLVFMAIHNSRNDSYIRQLHLWDQIICQTKTG